MNESEKLNAVIAELEQQRNWALTRCAEMAAFIAQLRKELEAARPKDRTEP